MCFPVGLFHAWRRPNEWSSPFTNLFRQVLPTQMHVVDCAICAPACAVCIHELWEFCSVVPGWLRAIAMMRWELIVAQVWYHFCKCLPHSLLLLPPRHVRIILCNQKLLPQNSASLVQLADNALLFPTCDIAYFRCYSEMPPLSGMFPYLGHSTPITLCLKMRLTNPIIM